MERANILTLPFPFNAANAAGGAMGRIGVRPSLDPETLKHTAIRQTDLHDFGDPSFNEGLKVLTRSAQDNAKLNFIGQVAVRQTILPLLRNRLKRVEAEKRRPEIFETPLTPPIVVPGLPHTGTTLLHRLIALDPKFRGIPAYEIFNPFPWEPREEKIKPLKRGVKMLNMAAPDIAKKHAPDIYEPEECTGLMASSFLCGSFWAAAPVYDYMEWLSSQDVTRNYTEYRSFLQILQSAQPEKRFALKSPLHTPHIDKMGDAFSGGMFVQTHRDPAAVISSLNSFVHTYHSIIAKADDERMAAFHVQLLVDETKRNLEIRKQQACLIHDVFYPELMEDPVGVVRGIYDFFGLEWGDQEIRINAYLKENPQTKHGKHVHRPDMFGLTNSRIRNAFSDYLGVFGERLGH